MCHRNSDRRRIIVLEFWFPRPAPHGEMASIETYVQTPTIDHLCRGTHYHVRPSKKVEHTTRAALCAIYLIKGNTYTKGSKSPAKEASP